MSVRVRRAVPGDGPKIHSVLQKLLARRIPEDLDPSKGFLLSDHDIDFFEQRIAASPLVFLAELENEAAGFLTAYPRPVFAPFVESSRAEDPSYAYILDHGGPDVVLLDQIGVLPEYRKRATAISLFESFASEAGPRPAMLTIIHAPVFNKQSADFFRNRLGFRLVHEVASEHAKGPITSGVYRRD